MAERESKGTNSKKKGLTDRTVRPEEVNIEIKKNVKKSKKRKGPCANGGSRVRPRLVREGEGVPGPVWISTKGITRKRYSRGTKKPEKHKPRYQVTRIEGEPAGIVKRQPQSNSLAEEVA